MKSDEKSWISTTQTGEPTGLDDTTKRLVNMVFARFKAIYGHRFESTYGDKMSLDIARREWGYCLIGYSEQQLAKALHTCKLTFAWPPAIAEFVALLLPSAAEIGVPTASVAYHEACQCRQDPRTFPWSHAIVYHAARDTGFWRLQHGSEKNIWPTFEHCYKSLMQRLSTGETLSVPDQILLEDKQSVTQAHTIQELADRLDIDAGELYFLTLPSGSPIRERLRQKVVNAHPKLVDNIPS